MAVGSVPKNKTLQSQCYLQVDFTQPCHAPRRDLLRSNPSAILKHTSQISLKIFICVAPRSRNLAASIESSYREVQFLLFCLMVEKCQIDIQKVEKYPRQKEKIEDQLKNREIRRGQLSIPIQKQIEDKDLA